MKKTKPTDNLNKVYADGCGLIRNQEGEVVGQERIREMSPFEIKERLELNIANTTEALRAKVVAHNAKGNGH